MCLVRQLEKGEVRSRKRTGYKVFRQRSDGVLEGADMRHMEHTGRNVRPVGEWIHEDMYRTHDIHCTHAALMSDDNKSYQTGFHIFMAQQDAKLYAQIDEVVRQVKFNKVTAHGMQHTKDGSMGYVIVAKEMYIPPE